MVGYLYQSPSPHCRPDTTVPHDSGTSVRNYMMQQHPTPKAATPYIEPEIIPCRLATLAADLGIYRPVPHYSRSDYAAGAYRHRPLCAADRNSGFGWAVFTARSRPGRSYRSRRAHWRGDLLQPLAPSISAIATRLRDRSETSSLGERARRCRSSRTAARITGTRNVAPRCRPKMPPS